MGWNPFKDVPFKDSKAIAEFYDRLEEAMETHAAIEVKMQDNAAQGNAGPLSEKDSERVNKTSLNVLGMLKDNSYVDVEKMDDYTKNTLPDVVSEIISGYASKYAAKETSGKPDLSHLVADNIQKLGPNKELGK